MSTVTSVKTVLISLEQNEAFQLMYFLQTHQPEEGHKLDDLLEDLQLELT